MRAKAQLPSHMIALALTAGWLMVIGMLSVCRLLNVGAARDVGVLGARRGLLKRAELVLARVLFLLLAGEVEGGLAVLATIMSTLVSVEAFGSVQVLLGKSFLSPHVGGCDDV
ncbi:hypothetical protein CCHR01_19477 [Colletotrichum chrysophilum]|uniref:Uncharacterized protein n=1 Tax=Colletotrichum chrysophilum TaxID=1836956 RepID=A0AAD9E537_9PEZI|nr:hypothetical protein CCHR01_19477 [Colletotrichum chrysophilum]